MATTWFKPTDLLDKIFEVSIIIKGIEGVFELLGAAVLIIGGQGIITWLTTLLTRQELSSDPHDTLSNFILHTGQHLASGGSTYVVAYLIVHGVIKLIAVFSLLRNQLWGYPFSLATLGIFMIYQIYQVYVDHSWFIAALTIFDVFLLWLIWREWQMQKVRMAGGTASATTKSA
jgi:uncharacterized membrane protein